MQWSSYLVSRTSLVVVTDVGDQIGGTTILHAAHAANDVILST
jgi:hypothetical protein